MPEDAAVVIDERELEVGGSIQVGPVDGHFSRIGNRRGRRDGERQGKNEIITKSSIIKDPTDYRI